MTAHIATLFMVSIMVSVQQQADADEKNDINTKIHTKQPISFVPVVQQKADADGNSSVTIKTQIDQTISVLSSSEKLLKTCLNPKLWPNNPDQSARTDYCECLEQGTLNKPNLINEILESFDPNHNLSSKGEASSLSDECAA